MPHPSPDLPEWLALVREKVETLNFGVVQIVVHDSRVTQIERTEKTRVTNDATTSSPAAPV
ncbi:MAG TPA: YezD family protein [Chthoniobacterales bacterium]|nr:YezD family protein [Chthoniobacterales bacterium]